MAETDDLIFVQYDRRRGARPVYDENRGSFNASNEDQFMVQSASDVS